MEREYVGIDFHRRRWEVVRLSAAGERLSVVRVDNDPVAIAAAVGEAGPGQEVVIEATYGWYWVLPERGRVAPARAEGTFRLIRLGEHLGDCGAAPTSDRRPSHCGVR